MLQKVVADLYQLLRPIVQASLANLEPQRWIESAASLAACETTEITRAVLDATHALEWVRAYVPSMTWVLWPGDLECDVVMIDLD